MQILLKIYTYFKFVAQIKFRKAESWKKLNPESKFKITGNTYDNIDLKRSLVWHRASALETQTKEFMLSSLIRIPLWDVETGPLDKTVTTEVLCLWKCWHEKDPSLLNSPECQV